MKLSRRKAMAAITGGTMAAPGALKQVMDGASNKLNMPPMANYGGMAETSYDISDISDKVAAQQNYIKSRIDKLRRFLNGELDHWQKEQLEQEESIEHRNMAQIDNMRSLSWAGKHQMALSSKRKLMRYHWKKQAEKELAELLNPTQGNKLG